MIVNKLQAAQNKQLKPIAVLSSRNYTVKNIVELENSGLCSININ